MALTHKEYDLSESSIEKISADLQAYLKNLNLERRNIQRIPDGSREGETTPGRPATSPGIALDR